MDMVPTRAFIDETYRRVYGARKAAGFGEYLSTHGPGQGRAALGYRRAGSQKFFIEQYFDHPIEFEIRTRLGLEIDRERIIEIGNLAADNAWSMISLWGKAANDLGLRGEVVVAALTAPLRRMFARIGVPLHELAPAEPTRLGPAAGDWGSYYLADPWVCLGSIAEGQQAITAFLGPRQSSAA